MSGNQSIGYRIGFLYWFLNLPMSDIGKFNWPLFSAVINFVERLFPPLNSKVATRQFRRLAALALASSQDANQQEVTRRVKSLAARMRWSQSGHSGKATNANGVVSVLDLSRRI